MSDLDNDLSRTLHQHAEDMSSTPLAFDDVRGRATSIRRRRRLATGLGVAAAVAVIVPTAMFATKGTSSDGQLPPATQPSIATDSAPPSPSSTPTMGADPHALDVRDLPTGTPPAYPVLGPDDTALAQTSEAVVRWTNEGVVVETAGRTLGPYPSSHGFQRNAAATAVAWATDEGDVMVWADGEDEPFVVAELGATDVRVGAVTGTDCRPGTAADCTYYVSRWNGTGPEAFAVSGDGSLGDVDPGRTIVSVRDATDDGRVLGITEVRDDLTTCSAVLDPAVSGSEPLIATCSHAFDAFSPDGSYVLASDSYGDGIGAGQVAIYATAGDVLAHRSTIGKSPAFYNDAVWEDETHVLLTVYQDGQWSMVRMNVDGAMEYAIAPQKGNQDNVPWRFETT